MTKGKPLSLLMRFSLPLMLANVLQFFYIIADSAVVGRMLGVTAFASIGASATLFWMISSAVISTTHGFGIVFAQRFGAKDMEGLRRAFATAGFLLAVICVVIGLIGIFGSRALLVLLNTPAELLDYSTIYLSWLLGGIIITAVFNLLGAALRALGDSKTPTKAMIISSVLNIILVFVLVTPLGIAGASIATLLAQSVGSVYSFIVLRRTGALSGNGLHWETNSAKTLLRLGLPLGFRDTVIAAGGLVVQWHINSYGVEFVAGVAIARRLYFLLMIGSNGLSAANATFTAQNFGAGNIERIRQGVNTGLKLMLTASAVTMAFTFLFGRFILSLLFEGDPYMVGAVLDVGVWQLNVMTAGLPLLYLLFLYRTTLEGIGKPLVPALSGFMELIFRLISVLLLSPFIGRWGIILSDPAGWLGAAALLMIAYYSVRKRLRAWA